jgi:alkanesulfonate monooxygenase SsuD/methylene tetrahydromethanopterin reductase-like flavin-dependent oxidoreductase (luciferase family)
MKVRIGIGTGAAGLGGDGLADLTDALVDVGLDSLWLSEILTGPGVDPLVGLAWAGAHNPKVKLGTTMLLPGRNPIRLAGQVAALDALSGGRFLLTFVPGLTIGAEREAVGVDPSRRGDVFDEVLPLLRRLWAGERVTHEGPARQLPRRRHRDLPSAGPVRCLAGRQCP